LAGFLVEGDNLRLGAARTTDQLSAINQRRFGIPKLLGAAVIIFFEGYSPDALPAGGFQADEVTLATHGINPLAVHGRRAHAGGSPAPGVIDLRRPEFLAILVAEGNHGRLAVASPHRADDTTIDDHSGVAVTESFGLPDKSRRLLPLVEQ